MLFQSKLGRAIAFATLLLAGPVAACAQIATPTVATVPGADSQVPFELFRGSRIVLEGTINGVETQMLLDSGASVTTIDRAYARKIGIREGVKIPAQGAGGTQEAELVQDIALEVGNMRMSGVTAAVIDLSAIEKAIGRPVPVILGRELLISSVVSLDFKNNRLSMSPAKGFVAPAGAQLIALEKEGPFRLLPVTIAGLPAKALLDLGNGGALSISKEYIDANPALLKFPRGVGFGGGVGGLHEIHRVTLPTLEVGGFTFESVPADLGTKPDGPYANYANAGIQLFKPFEVTLDLGNDRMWLKRNSSPANFTKDRAGLFVMLEGDHLDVLHVSPGGAAAAAGLKAGDKIVRVAGVDVGPAFYSSAQADWARGKPGTRVAITKSDGQQALLTLTDYY